MTRLVARAKTFFQYKHLFQELVIKDIKLKYRRSFLGYLWSVLNPLMTMVVMYLVFSNMFRFDIVNYPVYLIIGQTLYSFFAESTTQAIFSITSNGALLKKTYVPKYVFTIAKVSSSLVNMLFALGAMVFVLIYCKIKFTPLFLLLPIVLIQIYIFCLGLGMFLAQAAVFFRDVQYIYGVITTAWMYLTPIFYPITALPEYLQNLITTFNPLFYYITQFRQIVLYEQLPDSSYMISGGIIALVTFIVGSFCFSKTQDNFILYI